MTVAPRHYEPYSVQTFGLGYTDDLAQRAKTLFAGAPVTPQSRIFDFAMISN